ncbi:MAG: APC family permease [Acidobacteriota bacterium]|nr:APC family permease [Acidobacteriota bacterium]
MDKVSDQASPVRLTAPQGKLLRVLGVAFGLAVTVGATIGMGILRTPGDVAAQLPSAWLFIGVWLIGGLYALLGTLQVAELGTMIPRAGGIYVFARRALGSYAGFVVGCSDWLGTCGTIAAVAIVIGEYTAALVPVLASRAVSIALSVIVAFALLQWRGVRWGGRAQELTSLLKAVAFIALVTACFIFGGGSTAGASAAPPLPTGVTLLTAVVLSLQGVIFTYDGWYSAVYFSEEVREPERNLPRAMIGGVLLIIGIYLLVNLALVYVLPMSLIAGEKLAVGAAARAVFGALGGIIISVLATVSMLASVNANLLMAPRTLYAMSRDGLFGLFSRHATTVNAGGTPSVALFLSAAVAVLFTLSGTFEKVLALLAFFFVVNYAVTFVAVFVLRRREREAARPYRAWGYPWSTALVLLGSLAFLIGAVASDTQNSIYSLLLLAASYPIYLVLSRLNKKKQEAGTD